MPNGISDGLLMNFGGPRLEFERFYNREIVGLVPTHCVGIHPTACFRVQFQTSILTRPTYNRLIRSRHHSFYRDV